VGVYLPSVAEALERDEISGSVGELNVLHIVASLTGYGELVLRDVLGRHTQRGIQAISGTWAPPAGSTTAI
jgi:hypothetical protein